MKAMRPALPIKGEAMEDMGPGLQYPLLVE